MEYFNTEKDRKKGKKNKIKVRKVFPEVEQITSKYPAYLCISLQSLSIYHSTMLHGLFLVLGGLICSASCIATVGIGGFIGGAAVLPLLGFTSSGIVAGSWAAAWMASFHGVVPAGCLFAKLQAAGAAGLSPKSLGSVFELCTNVCTIFP